MTTENTLIKNTTNTTKTIKLYGFIKDDNLWVWCNICSCWHVHGKPNNNEGDVFKSAHCPHTDKYFNKRPYDYYVVKYKKYEDLTVDVINKYFPCGINTNYNRKKKPYFGSDYLKDYNLMRTLQQSVGRYYNDVLGQIKQEATACVYTL